MFGTGEFFFLFISFFFFSFLLYNVPQVTAVYLVPLNFQSVPIFFFFTVLQINRKIVIILIFNFAIHASMHIRLGIPH